MEKVTDRYHDAAVELVRMYGTESQAGRLELGLLPDEELCAAVRDYLFKPIAALPRWVRVDKETIRQRAAERGLAGPDDPVATENVTADALTGPEFAKRIGIVDALDAHLKGRPLFERWTVDHLWLVVSCGSYEKRHTKLRVTIKWCGVEHVREVAL